MNPVTKQVMNQGLSRVRRQVLLQVYLSVERQVRFQVSNQVWNQVDERVRYQVRNKVWNKTKTES